MAAQRDPDTLRALNGADLVVPDGMPIVWAGRLAGAAGIARVYGPDLMLALCEQAGRRGWPIFLYGGEKGVSDRLAARMKLRFPLIQVVGSFSPPFRALHSHEYDAIANRIVESGAQLVWVGLSSPKQDLWMAEMKRRLQGAPVVLIGVGAAFDIHAGLKRQPPRWMGPLGLYWFYRLLQEPRRLWHRYSRDIPAFLLKVARNPPALRSHSAIVQASTSTR